MPDIVSIGEALIDFLSIDREVSLEETSGFTVAPGGAPANLAAAVSKLGGSSGFIGKVGMDAFGRKIRDTLLHTGVDVEHLVLDRSVNTTLAFIAVKRNSEPDFMFFRRHCGADLALRRSEIDEGYVSESRVLHFGSLSFTGEPLGAATERAIAFARGAGRIVTYDPNLRPSLWESMEQAKARITGGLEYADIVKCTQEEMEFITDTNDLLKGTNSIMKYGPRMVIMTRGGESCFFNNGDVSFEFPTYEVKCVDTTGAGDAFFGGVLVNLVDMMKKDLPVFDIDRETAERIMRFACACGAITVTKKGVIPALPTRAEVEVFLESRTG
ncbi:MAG: carbohydrate kinase [Spirochaetes bacterium]|nr:carbohydrate kinase [Spirochaetota bacterium]